MKLLTSYVAIQIGDSVQLDKFYIILDSSVSLHIMRNYVDYFLFLFINIDTLNYSYFNDYCFLNNIS